MKKTIWALLLVVSIFSVCLAFTAQADTALELKVAASGGDYTTVEEALADVETMAKIGELNDKGVRLVLSGTHTATVSDSLLFGQKTIFLPNGKKLPITITGGVLNLPAGDVACANDYTFTDLTIPFDDVAVKLYAGSGEVTLQNITVNANSTTGENKSRFYADNFTANAYKGWTEANLAAHSEEGLTVSSLTLGEGFTYKTGSTYSIATVGSSTDFSAKVGAKTVSADDTCPKLIIDGAVINHTMVRIGSNRVADSVLLIKSGTVDHIYAALSSFQSTVHGDITVTVLGGDINDFPRILNKVCVNGDVNVTFKNMDLSANTAKDSKMIQIGFGGAYVNGDVNVYMENVKGDRFFGANSGSGTTCTGDISVTAKNCVFSSYYYGGFGQSSIVGNVTNHLENVELGTYRGLNECPSLKGNLTTVWKNVTIADKTSEANVYVGTVATTAVEGNYVTTIEDSYLGDNVNLYMGNNNGTLNGNITTTVKSGTFYEYFYGANWKGTVTGTVTNNIQGGDFYQEVYLSGFYNDIQGQVINNISGGTFQKLYLFCGTRSGKISNTTADYAMKNYFSGGSFKGVWGGSGGGAAVQKGNIYNEITGGTFSTYSTDNSKMNSFAGGPRNTKHTGNVKTLIRGGVFEGWVAGGSIPNDTSYANTHEGNTEITIAGGDFRHTVTADCRWGNYSGTTRLFIDTEKAVEPLKFAQALTCDSFIASSDSFELVMNQNLTATEIIARGTKPMTLVGKVSCERFTVESGAAAPAIYNTASIGKISTDGSPINLGAKTKITAGEVVGSVTLNQTELWTANTYFASPASSKIILTEDEDVFGRVQLKNGTVKGLSTAVAGVSFIFTDTVCLRFAFDKEWVDSVKSDFTFYAKIGNSVLINSLTFDRLVLKDGYYTVVSEPISATELCEDVIYYGKYIPEQSFTLNEVAATGIKMYGKDGLNPELANLLKAFSNYAVATDNYKKKKSTPLPYDNLATETDFATLQTDMNATSNRGIGYMPLTSTDHVILTGKQFILDEGFRIRYTLQGQKLYSWNQSSAKVHSLHFWNGCEDITSTITKTWVKSGLQGYYEITVDIPVAISSAADSYVRFLVTEQDTLNQKTTYVIDNIDRMDALAEQLSGVSGGEELGSALLYYIQAGNEYFANRKPLEDYVYPETFSAGWATSDISSYGYRLHMYSYAVGQIYMDPCYVTCLAMWDGDNLALYYSVDVRQCDDTFTKEYKAFLSERFDVDPDMIFFNATHNHSGPDTTQRAKTNVRRWYSEIFEPALISATENAILDLAPSEVYAGKATSDPGTNFVRRYVRQSGAYSGIHVYEPDSNIDTTDPIVGYESEADKELRTIRFEREGKKDIIFANWQGHAAHGANQYSTQFTADFVGFLRDGVQKDMDAHFIYCNGSSGNINFTPKTQADKNAKYFTGNYFDGIGKSLVGTVKKAVGSEQKIETGKLEVTHIAYQAPVKVDADDLREKAILVNNACKAYTAENGAWTSVSQQRNYIFNNFATEAPYLQSTYHLSSIITRNTYKTEGTTHLTIDIFALSCGDIAMGFVPYEQFDTNGKQMRDGVADLYKICFSAGYTNGTKSYVPSNLSSIDNEAAKVHYGGYEVYTCRYEDGTGDGVAAALTKALREMAK